MMKNLSFKHLVVFSGLFFIFFLSGRVIGDEVKFQDIKRSLDKYHITLSETPHEYAGSSVYRQVIPKSKGKSTFKLVEHGTYSYNDLELYSQDPRYATVNGYPFIDYVIGSHDVEDSSPLFSMNSEMVLCWLSDEGVLVEVEEVRIRKYLSDERMDFNNRCVDNRTLKDYWKVRNRVTQIR